MAEGLRTFFITDVEGSSLKWLDHRVAMQAALARHDEILRDVIAGEGGQVFKTAGDAFFALFETPAAAVRAAIAAQRRLGDLDWSAVAGLTVRMAVHTGTAERRGDDWFGPALNRAARLLALGHGGQILVTSGTAELLAAERAIDEPARFLGSHALDDPKQPVAIHQICAAGLAQDFPPLRTAQLAEPRTAICVLPFANMSDDPQQDYFSDGISEDIITDLAKVSALSVIARNTAFLFKGKSVDVPQLARQLKVSHVLEGSVRKSGQRVRITAQLIDGAVGDHLWAERYDRDLNDIFALQDEVTQAIVDALKLKLLPEEKKAIEQRGTASVEAWNLYLMARQTYITGNEGDLRREETIVRLCTRATEIDPGYAQAWVLMALSQTLLLTLHGKPGDGGLAAADRALALDAGLAEAHAVRAWVLISNGENDAAWPEVETALRLDPESYEVNKAAGYVSYRLNRLADAARYFEKSVALMATDCNALGMLISCYTAAGDTTNMRRVAKLTVARAEAIIARDPNNGAVLGYGMGALVVLGEVARAREWMARALLIDPDNMNMRYNFACTMSAQLKDVDAALDLLAVVFEKVPGDFLNHARADPDLDFIRNEPRFKTMIAAAGARLAAQGR